MRNNLSFAKEEKQILWAIQTKANCFYENGEKIFPLFFMEKSTNPFLIQAIKRITPLYEKNKKKITEFILSIPNKINGVNCISDIRKTCILKFLELREKELVKVYSKITEKTQNNE